jgi:Holliday junction DNA helicase RuvA
MITFLEGTLVERHPTRIVIACGGVGYELAIPLSTFDRLPEQGQTCRILTRLIVREDAHLLFGFASRPERALFDLLLVVSRVGPKIALAVLSGLSVTQIRQAIAFQDAAMLASVPGLGRKTAERIVVELKDRIDKGIAGAEPMMPGQGAQRRVGPMDEAMAALVALGYSRAEAQDAVTQAVRNIGGTASTEDVVRAALTATVT